MWGLQWNLKLSLAEEKRESRASACTIGLHNLRSHNIHKGTNIIVNLDTQTIFGGSSVYESTNTTTSEVAEEMMSAHRDIFLFSVTRVLVLTVPVTLILEVSGQNIIPEFKGPFDENTKGNFDYISTYSTPLFDLAELNGILKLLSKNIF